MNENGKVRINYNLPDLSQTSHPLNARITTRVYEKGGSFTSHSEIIKIYPHVAQAGIKNIFKSRSVKLGEKYQVPIVVVDTKGKPVSNHRLQVAVYVNRDHWWWDYDRREQRDFRMMESTYLVEKHNYLSGGEPLLHTMSVDDYGRHYIEVTDLDSGHRSGIFFYVSGWGQLPAEERKLNYLQITSDKNVYNIGDQAKLSFESPQAGMALLTVEQGSRIISTNWKNVSPGQTTFTVNLNKEMLPNCYASISMIQPHNQNTNDVPMRLYGIKTLYVEDKNTRLPLTMELPSELKPKEKFSVQISSRALLPASCTIAIVDEGLLDITGFETPDPWNYFFEKIRLGVTTMDNYDEILGLLYPDIDKYFSIGGGMMADARKKRLDQSKTRRFKPAVIFQEPIQIGPGETVTTAFTMPNYVGAVRVMVIGTAGHHYISLEETIPVKQPLTLLPTVPRLVRPGDDFALPVSVFALDETVKEAKITLEISSNLSVTGPVSKTVTFTKPGESDIKFMLKAGDAIGTADITIKGVSGSNTADYNVQLPIVSANPFFTEVQDTIIQPNKAITLIPRKFGLAGTNKAKIALSRMPDIQLDKRYAYLLRYPYGCIEQTVSSAFPQLFLNQLTDLREHQKKAVTDHINATIKRLSNFMTGQGFSFWPASTFVREKYSDWGSTYAGHFLVEARARGYHVPEALYQHWLDDAKDRAKDINKTDHRYQAYRLFVLALSGEAQIGTMNLLREDYLPRLDPLSKHFLAASYFLNGQKKEAAEIESHSTTEITDYREQSRTYGSALRDRSLIAYLKLKMEDQATAAKLLRDIYKSYSAGRWYSTQETAMTLLCIGTYYDQFPFPGGAVTYKIKLDKDEEKTATLSSYQSIIALDDMWDKEIHITNESGNPLYVTLLREGIPLDDRIKSESFGLSLQRNFYNEEGQPITVSESIQAKPFWVIYTVTSTYASPMKELALSSVFPAGWEIINTRLGSDPLPPWVRKLRLTMGSYMDIRDDRINWFFDLNSKQKIVLGTKINPTFSGEYTMPPVVVEPMYSPEFYARIKGDVVRVK